MVSLKQDIFAIIEPNLSLLGFVVSGILAKGTNLVMPSLSFSYLMITYLFCYFVIIPYFLMLSEYLNETGTLDLEE